MQVKLNHFVRGVGSEGEVVDVTEEVGNKLISLGAGNRFPGGITRRRTSGAAVAEVKQQQVIPEYSEDGEPVNEPAKKISKSRKQSKETNDTDEGTDGE